jgi:hypothetical protein
MPANTSPIYTRVGNNDWCNLAAANTAKDGTGTVGTVFTADATNGSYVESVVVRPLASVVATAVRIFINNGSTNATATNNSLIAEFTLAATTNSEVAAIAGAEIPIRRMLDPGFKLLVTLGTWSTGSVQFTAMGGDY